MTLAPRHADALTLCTTDELVAHYTATTALPKDTVLAIVTAGVDTLYDNRNDGGNMHSAGAAAAIEAVLAYRRTAWALPPPERKLAGMTPERLTEEYDPQPYTDPQGVTHPVEPSDVLDPQELRRYRQERGER